MNKIHNYSVVSKLLTGDRTAIRSNYSGKKYKKAIQELRDFEKIWTDKYNLKRRTWKHI